MPKVITSKDQELRIKKKFAFFPRHMLDLPENEMIYLTNYYAIQRYHRSINEWQDIYVYVKRELRERVAEYSTAEAAKAVCSKLRPGE